MCVEGCPFICVLRSVVMVEDSESCGGCQSLSEHRLLASFDEWNVEKRQLRNTVASSEFELALVRLLQVNKKKVNIITNSFLYFSL